MSKANARAMSENSRVQMTQAIIGLIEGKAPRQVSDEMEIPYTRILRWQKDPDFVELYAQTEAELVTQVKADAARMISARLDILGPRAVSVLEEALDSDKTSDRLNAAKAILAFNGVGRTPRTTAPVADVLPIEARIRQRALDVSPTSGD